MNCQNRRDCQRLQIERSAPQSVQFRRCLAILAFTAIWSDAPSSIKAVGIPRYARDFKKSYARNASAPPTTVAITFPCICFPSNGEFFDFECDCATWYVHFFAGSKMVTSARAPTASVPRPCRFITRAGLADSNRSEEHTSE